MRDLASGARAAGGIALLLIVGGAQTTAAQQAATPYPTMAAIDQYIMTDRAAEIALARSAAPASISRDATILVLGRQGFETAVEGKNGFVCLVDRGWTGPFDWPEFWNPKIRAAAYMNPQAVRSVLPIEKLRTRMVMAGHSTAEILTVLDSAFDNGRLPKLESGAMAYMMAKSAYLTDQGEHNGPHVMFYTDLENIEDWGANTEDSPILASPYWYFSPDAKAQQKSFPPIIVFLVGLSNWSDGTLAGGHEDNLDGADGKVRHGKDHPVGLQESRQTKGSVREAGVMRR